jgi:alpha-galactosidase
MPVSEISALFQPSPLLLQADFRHEYWQRAHPLSIACNWRGDPAPAELRTVARALWTPDALGFGFECRYTELDMDSEYSLEQERYALWERDVCEAFVRSPNEPGEKIYKEFEAAPTGQWCDLQIDRARMKHDWEWRSGMQTAHGINEAEKIWRVVMVIPFEAFGLRPQSGNCWQANLFRISRLNGERQYLALSPTLTERPNFHVPERFVPLRFVD